MLSKFKIFFGSYSFVKKVNKNSNIYSSEEFRKIIKRARARSDRTGNTFSVAVFDMANNNMDKFSLDDLVNCAKERVRSTDVIGWFNALSVGIFLYNLPPHQAWQVADDICRKVGVKTAASFCRIFAYPCRYSSSKENSLEETNNKGLFLLEQSKKKSLKMSSKTQFAEKSFQINTENVHRVRKNTFRTAIALEPVLGCPLPVWKRGLDIFVSLTGLILLSPFWLVVALFIKSVSPGPIFFTQKRIGYLGKPFTFWKFRTMCINSDTTDHMNHVHDLIQNEKPMNKLDNKNSQIIPFGKILRRSCIDELPQLLNVLRGEMSLVGPRPCLPYEFHEYHLWHKQRFDTLPGMTGLWQVKGKNRTTFKEMIRLDIAYEQRISVWQDLMILFYTIPSIFVQTG
jgi:lipopolysaccharide/colanic/teichoic acid biosynthesis glycosyltransferase